jgi:SAM-dependent methyltransferase
MSIDELKHIAEAVGERRGWDFSTVHDDHDPYPWEYHEVARRYLTQLQRVLDIGTGGGERFLQLAEYFGSGIGIDADPEMVDVAQHNTPDNVNCRVKFLAMDAAELEFPDESFDVVLNRHAPAYADEIARVLRPGGYFVTQQVGARNTANICALFGCGPGGEYGEEPDQTVTAWSDAFQARGFAVRCRGEYDVPYYFLDTESLLFWLKAIPIPHDFDLDRHWPQVDHILTEFHTPRGIATNEHRELLIVQKPYTAS